MYVGNGLTRQSFVRVRVQSGTLVLGKRFYAGLGHAKHPCCGWEGSSVFHQFVGSGGCSRYCGDHGFLSLSGFIGKPFLVASELDLFYAQN